MKRIAILCFTVLMTLMTSNCGKRVIVSPRIDLKNYEIVGIIEFTCTNEGELGPLATRKFTEAIREDQGMIRIIDLGTKKEVLKKIGHVKLDKDAYEAIGQEFDVKTFFVGEVVVSNIRPKINIGLGLELVSFSAEIDAKLNAKMIGTPTGASIWSSSASATREVGNVSLLGGKIFAFNAEDPDEAYGDLVDYLAYRTTRDFRVTWERR